MRRLFPSLLAYLSVVSTLHAQPLPGTKPLEMQGDIAKQMVEGIDRYLTRELAASVEKRKAYWKPDYTSAEAYEKSITPNRERLKKILGVVDTRATEMPAIMFTNDPKGLDRVFLTLAKGRPFFLITEAESLRWPLTEFAQQRNITNGQVTRDQFHEFTGQLKLNIYYAMEHVGKGSPWSLLAQGKNCNIFAVRWSVLPGVYAEGLLLEPKDDRTRPKACIVAIPDADQTPEMISGLAPGLPRESQFARLLADSGCRVIVPTLINRQDTYSGNAKLNRFTNQTNREFIYRMSYEMGRHVIGYEVQKVLAAVDWFRRDDLVTPEKDRLPVGVYGYGEGGLLALYSAAIDTRIDSTVVSGYFGPRENLHDEPIYRNVWSLLKEFGDGEIMRLILPRSLTIEQAPFSSGQPPSARAGRGGAAPGIAASPPIKATMLEFNRILQSLPALEMFPRKSVQLVAPMMRRRRAPRFVIISRDWRILLSRTTTGHSQKTPLGSTIPKAGSVANSTSSSITRRSSFPIRRRAARSSSGTSSTRPRSTSSRNRSSRCATTSGRTSSASSPRRRCRSTRACACTTRRRSTRPTKSSWTCTTT